MCRFAEARSVFTAHYQRHVFGEDKGKPRSSIEFELLNEKEDDDTTTAVVYRKGEDQEGVTRWPALEDLGGVEPNTRRFDRSVLQVVPLCDLAPVAKRRARGLAEGWGPKKVTKGGAEAGSSKRAEEGGGNNILAGARRREAHTRSVASITGSYACPRIRWRLLLS